MAALEEARAKMIFLSLDQMMKQCCLAYSFKGNKRILQIHLFIGIILDTLRGRILLERRSLTKRWRCCTKCTQQSECSPRGMAKLRGKFGQKVRCVEGVSLFLIPFNQFVGASETAAEWDEAKPARIWSTTCTGSRQEDRWQCKFYGT
mmetsp:Transcript_41002/g.85579  ORF Transcript_41002/g.85579 Transcript_41002/m.85579 type:complete len:148 (+) Transcript_41002:916-1359(+)